MKTLTTVQLYLFYVEKVGRGFFEGDVQPYRTGNIAYRGVCKCEAVGERVGLETIYNPSFATGSDSLVGITFPHHMRFYNENCEDSSEVRVQQKHYCKDSWGPELGKKMYRSLPNREE